MPTADSLPQTGTVKLSDGVTYTVVAPGTTLKLDNVTLHIDHVDWRRRVSVAVEATGTRVYGVFKVTIQNRSSEDATLGPTQIWLRNEGNRPFLAAGQAGVPNPLVGRLAAGGRHRHRHARLPVARQAGRRAAALPAGRPAGHREARGDRPLLDD